MLLPTLESQILISVGTRVQACRVSVSNLEIPSLLPQTF